MSPLHGLELLALAFALGFIAGEFRAARLHEKWGYCHCHRHEGQATHVVFTNEEGEEVMDITFKVGDPAVKRRAVPRDDNNIEDTTFQDLKHGYGDPASGLTTAPDGSSNFSADGLVLIVAPGPVPSALDGNGNPIPSEIQTGLDSDAGPGVQLIKGVLRVTTLPADDTVKATRVDYEDVV